jgi:hypothetical protein
MGQLTGPVNTFLDFVDHVPVNEGSMLAVAVRKKRKQGIRVINSFAIVIVSL